MLRLGASKIKSSDLVSGVAQHCLKRRVEPVSLLHKGPVASSAWRSGPPSTVRSFSLDARPRAAGQLGRNTSADIPLQAPNGKAAGLTPNLESL